MIWKFHKKEGTTSVYADGVKVAVIRQYNWGGCRIETKDGVHNSRNMQAAKLRVRAVVNDSVRSQKS